MRGGGVKRRDREKGEKEKNGVPVVTQWSINLTSILEDVGLIPGPAEWVKAPVLLGAVV